MEASDGDRAVGQECGVGLELGRVPLCMVDGEKRAVVAAADHPAGEVLPFYGV